MGEGTPGVASCTCVVVASCMGEIACCVGERVLVVANCIGEETLVVASCVGEIACCVGEGTPVVACCIEEIVR